MEQSINYIKENFKIQIKTLKEYKINIYFSFLTTIGFTLSTLLFVGVLSSQFNELLNWTYKEYIYFIEISGFIGLTFGMFWFGSVLHRHLLDGRFNIYLTKPKSVFLQYVMNSSFLFTSFAGFMHLIILISFFFIYLDLPIYKFIISLIFSLIGGIFFVLIFRLLDSISFFVKDRFYFNIYLRGHEVYDKFPVIMFKGTLKTIGGFFSVAYYGVYSTEYVFGNISFYELLNLTSYLLGLILFCIISIWILWHYGLKKYEAFG